MQPSRARRGTALVALSAVGVATVLALAPAAAITASRMPSPLTPVTVELPAGALEQGTRIREVPVGLPRGTRVAAVADVESYAVAAVGPVAAVEVTRLLSTPAYGTPGPSIEPRSFDYPFRYPAVDALLEAVPQSRLEEHGSSLAAALMLLAANPNLPYDVGNAAAHIAFGVLERAREGGSCDPQLNLLTLIASDDETAPGDVGAELIRAQRACPADPTPGWVVTERLVQQHPGVADVTSLQPYDSGTLTSAAATATALAHTFPHDPGVLATLGDVFLTLGTYPSKAQPFAAREALRRADAVFARLRDGGLAGAAALGAARARLGLGDPEGAARLATGAATSAKVPARAQALVIMAQERAHHFDTASALAKRLAESGPGAYPPRTALIPLGPPLALGFDTLTPLNVTLQGGGQGGGGTVVDEGFIPTYRDDFGLTDDAPDCPAWVWRRDAMIAGHASAAAAGWPADFTPAEPSDAAYCPSGAPLKEHVDALVTRQLPTNLDDTKVRQKVELLLDARQNVLRWAGDLPGARRETQLWATHLGDQTALAQQRLGEIDYLSGDYTAAAADFAEAVVRWRVLDSGNDLAVDQSLLDQGASLLKAGRAGEAVEILRPLVLEGAQGYGYQRSQQEYSTADEFARLSYYAATLLADRELADGQEHAAADDLRAALLWAKALGDQVHLDAARNSAAVAAIDTGDLARAVSLSRAAVEADPASPVYLMTAAEVAYRAGDTDNAIRQGRAALASDPTDYPAANNLGVLLARQGHAEQASRVLRAAVDAEPRYALAWFNLGIVEGRRGPLHVVPSQGALARAIALDAGYADAPHHTVLDVHTYRTGLDVSKALPAGWTFAGSQRRAPIATVGLLAAALAAIGLVSLRDNSPSSGAKDWLESLGSRLGRARVTRRLRRPWLAVVATVGAFLLAFWRDPLWPWTGIAYGACLVALVGAGMVARWLVARRRVGGVVHGTWSPGVLVGLASAAFGVPIAPLPVVRAPAKDAGVAVAAPLTLAALSLALLLESALLHTPLTTSLCIAAFIMAGSVLLPVKPLDGARAGAAGVAGAAGLLGTVLLLGLGLV